MKLLAAARLLSPRMVLSWMSRTSADRPSGPSSRGRVTAPSGLA